MDARARGFRHEPPPGLFPDAAVVKLREVLDSIGDTCPECPPVFGRGVAIQTSRMQRSARTKLKLGHKAIEYYLSQQKRTSRRQLGLI